MNASEIQMMFNKLNGKTPSAKTVSGLQLADPLGSVYAKGGMKLPGTNPNAGGPPPTFPQFGQSALSPNGSIFKLEG